MIKGRSKRKQIYKLKLTKYLAPYIATELSETSSKEIFNEPMDQPNKISQQIVNQKMKKEETIKIKENRKMKVVSIIIGIFILLILAIPKIIDYYSQKELSMARDKIKQEQILPESTQEQSTINSYSKQLSSLEESINFLSQPNFSQMIIFVRDDGNAVYITIKDSFWYNLTTSQQKQLADRMLDIIYASGDVTRHLYIKDEHSRVVAEQHKEKIGVGLTLGPYMDLK